MLATGGGRPKDLPCGFFREPTIFGAARNDMRIGREDREGGRWGMHEYAEIQTIAWKSAPRYTAETNVARSTPNAGSAKVVHPHRGQSANPATRGEAGPYRCGECQLVWNLLRGGAWMKLLPT